MVKHKELKVKVNYPTDAKVLKELENRGAKAIARAWANELSSKQLDELIEKLSEKIL